MSSENASQIFAKIYKSRNILLELLKLGGYNIDDYHGFSSSMLNSMIETKNSMRKYINIDSVIGIKRSFSCSLIV